MVTEEFQKALDASVKSQMDGLVEKMKDSQVTKEFVADELAKITKEAEKGTAELKASVENLKEIIKTVQATSTPKLPESFKQSIANIVKENHENIVKAIKDKGAISLKVAAPYMNSNGTITAGATGGLTSENVDYSNQLVTIRHSANVVLDNFPTVLVDSVSSNRVLIEQSSEEGEIAITAEGALKPLVSDKFVKTMTSRIKHAGHIEWSEEFEKDHNALLIAIYRLFENKIWRKFDDDVLDGVLTSATAYVGSTLDGTFTRPDNGLVAIALATQIRQLNGNADIVFMNHADITATKYVQDASGTPINQFDAIDLREGTLAGMRLVGSNKVPKGTILVGESRSYIVEYERAKLKTGYINDQFVKNMFTIVGEMYSLTSIAEMDLKYWVKGDLAVIKTALLKK